jgi:hypothetical protein
VPIPVTYLLLSDRANDAALITPDCIRAGKASCGSQAESKQTNIAVRRSHIWVLLLLRNVVQRPPQRLIQINRLSGLVPPLAQCRLLGLADSLARFSGVAATSSACSEKTHQRSFQQAKRLARDHKTECRARYIAVLSDDPPDWKPHCIECDTPFGPVLGRAVYSLFAVID